MYLVMTALQKLPRVTGQVLYRGVRGEVNLDKDHYSKGNVVVWPALSSTSPDMETTKAFLAKGVNEQRGKRNSVHHQQRVGLQNPAVLAVP